MRKFRTQLPELIKRRIELSKIFTTSNQTEKRRWGKLFFDGFQSTAEKMLALAEQKKYDQEIVSSNTIIWKNRESGTAECIFCYINDITNIKSVTTVFRFIKKYNPLFTYGIVRQFKDGIGVFDIFRFSKFSYLEHHNRVKVPK